MKNKAILLSYATGVISLLSELLAGEEQTVAYITTAHEKDESSVWAKNDIKALRSIKNLKIFEYTISGKNYFGISSDLKDADIIYVAGGNVFYLLEQAAKSGFFRYIQESIKSSKTYIGQSAGAIIAGPDIWPARRSDLLNGESELNNYQGFGLVDFTVLPHWGSEEKRLAYFEERLQYVYNEDQVYLPISDYQMVLVENGYVKILDAKSAKK